MFLLSDLNIFIRSKLILLDIYFVFNSQKKYGLRDIQAAVVDGKAYCTFVRDASTEISGIVFDLDKDRFHVMVATGPVNPSEYYICL